MTTLLLRATAFRKQRKSKLIVTPEEQETIIAWLTGAISTTQILWALGYNSNENTRTNAWLAPRIREMFLSGILTISDDYHPEDHPEDQKDQKDQKDPK